MGIVDKFKNLFTVEVDEEEPIKKEVIQVEIETPIKKEEKIILPIEKEEVKEEKIQQPVFFDDQEFDTMTRTSAPKREYYQKKETVKKEEKPKKFNPSPVISPVYGVLDKNYTKEDVKPSKVNDFEFTRTGEITIDDIRKKAYGTLEDELEITLFKEKVIKPVKKDEIDMFDELEDMDSLEELNDLDSKEVELLREVRQEKIEDELDLNKEDLFDLIDSMYEKRGEE